jgi:hypothetical protein
MRDCFAVHHLSYVPLLAAAAILVATVGDPLVEMIARTGFIGGGYDCSSPAIATSALVESDDRGRLLNSCPRRRAEECYERPCTLPPTHRDECSSGKPFSSTPDGVAETAFSA